MAIGGGGAAGGGAMSAGGAGGGAGGGGASAAGGAAGAGATGASCACASSEAKRPERTTAPPRMWLWIFVMFTARALFGARVADGFVCFGKGSARKFNGVRGPSLAGS